MAEYTQIIEGIITLLLLVLFAPLIPNKRWRYYTCYAGYVTVVSLAGIVLFPILILRPKNILNLLLSAHCLRPYTRVLGIEWELRNGSILKEDRGAVITSNHQSILDIMGMFNIWDVMGKCTAVAKKELLYIVPFGPTAWLSGIVFIDRVEPKKANQVLCSAAQIMHSLKAKFWVFPEGTRNKTSEELLPFKRGAFKTAIECKAPVIPLVYSPYYFIDSKNKTFGWGKIIIKVLEPISTEGMTLDDIAELRDKTYRAMSEEYRKLKDEISTLQNNNVHKIKS